MAIDCWRLRGAHWAGPLRIEPLIKTGVVHVVLALARKQLSALVGLAGVGLVGRNIAVADDADFRDWNLIELLFERSCGDWSRLSAACAVGLGLAVVCSAVDHR